MNIEMAIYIDLRGWKYQVIPGIGGGTFKARYQKPGNGKWSCCNNLPWQSTPEAAEADLRELAAKKGWYKCCKVSCEALSHIVQNRKPKGRFWAIEKGVWVAVDNTASDARIKKFSSLDGALMWLCHIERDERE